MKISELISELQKHPNQSDEVLVHTEQGFCYINHVLKTCDRGDFSIEALVISPYEKE